MIFSQVSPISLKNVACQIVVSLMPCLEGQPEELRAPHLGAVVEILPSLPVLELVNTVLQEARGVLSLQDQLKQATDGLRHENLSVRYVTAGELNKVLHSKRKDIDAMLLGEAAQDADVISSLVTALLRGCVEESRTAMSQRLKMACAECLGELGAIDPVKLQVSLLAHIVANLGLSCLGYALFLQIERC